MCCVFVARSSSTALKKFFFSISTSYTILQRRRTWISLLPPRLQSRRSPGIRLFRYYLFPRDYGDGASFAMRNRFEMCNRALMALEGF